MGNRRAPRGSAEAGTAALDPGGHVDELRLRNLTGHEIVLVSPTGDRLVLEPDGEPAVLVTEAVEVGEVHDIPIVSIRHGALTGLPQPEEGVLLVTSQVVARYAAQLARDDVVAPDTSPASAIREHGKVVAVRRLATFDPT